jgi:hypothetical protein
MKIFLDDDPMRDSWVDDTWTIVRTAYECLDLIAEHPGEVEILSLDHDLGPDIMIHGDGYMVVEVLERLVGQGAIRPIILPKKIEIHTANPVGRKNMQAAIDSIERLRSNGLD